MSGAITTEEFERRLETGTQAITIVGMSNIGKSKWSHRLAEQAGFNHICCDDLIEAELGDVLEAEGYRGITDVAKWLGQPYDPQFAENQQKYLDLEVDAMEAIMADLEHGRVSGNTVIDTTGSVVHTSKEICQKLGGLSTVVYLEASGAQQRAMFDLYIKEPKPVVWGDSYKPQGSESPQQALARCYPDLLAYRSSLYAEMAHVTFPREVLQGITVAGEFLDQVSTSLVRS